MRKLRLVLEDLAVESFDTARGPDITRGTVQANEYCCCCCCYPCCCGQSYGDTCYASCQASCNGTCNTCLASCNGTCDASCNGTCYGTCDASCNYTECRVDCPTNYFWNGQCYMP